MENPMEEIAEIAHRLPTWVLKDIDKRTTDWLSGGGKVDDPYIEQQLRFARNVLKSEERLNGNRQIG